MTWTGGVTYVTVATPSAKRYFDLDAVREPGASHDRPTGRSNGKKGRERTDVAKWDDHLEHHPAGAPPLDWHIEDPDWRPPDPEQGTDVTARLIIGDTRDVTATIPDGSIDIIVTSTPFLALRSYLPADHPDKWREIGSEPTPADFLDTLLELTAEWRRVLAPHGSICVELGDTYSGSGGAGGDYNAGGLREGQDTWESPSGRAKSATTAGNPTGLGSGAARTALESRMGKDAKNRGNTSKGTARQQRDHPGGWPLAKSLCGIPTLYTWSLAYGRNLLTGQPSPAGQWRIRNLIVWARPNPPVGKLGDKFRPATSYITVACTSARRWFDLDAVRTEHRTEDWDRPRIGSKGITARGDSGVNRGSNPAGAPPLDWHSDMPDEDGDWLWKLATAPYKGAHYATYPFELPRRLIDAMCPRRVCTTCGKPSERIVEAARRSEKDDRQRKVKAGEYRLNGHDHPPEIGWEFDRTTLGWTDCGCKCYSCGNQSTTPDGPPTCDHKWRNGIVLDPFAGSGTTLEAATALGRDSIGIDLDPRNAHLAEQRCGMFLAVDNPDPQPVRGWVDVPLPAWEEDAS